MIRYRLFAVDPLTQEERPLDGTYPLELARRLIARAYQEPRYSQVLVARPVQIARRRRAYFVECPGRRWHLVADSEYAACREAARRGVPARVWWCRDDYLAGCAPLIELRRATA